MSLLLLFNSFAPVVAIHPIGKFIEFAASQTLDTSSPNEFAAITGGTLTSDSVIPLEILTGLVEDSVDPSSLSSSRNQDGLLRSEYLSSFQNDALLRSEYLFTERSDFIDPTEFLGSNKQDGNDPIENLSSQKTDNYPQLEWGAFKGRDVLVNSEFLTGFRNDGAAPFEDLRGQQNDLNQPIEFTSLSRFDQIFLTEYLRSSQQIDRNILSEFILGVKSDNIALIEILKRIVCDNIALIEWIGSVSLFTDMNCPLEFRGNLSSDSLILFEMFAAQRADSLAFSESLFGIKTDLANQLDYLRGSLRDKFNQLEFHQGVRADFNAFMEVIATNMRLDSLLRSEFVFPASRDLINPIEVGSAQAHDLINPIEILSLAAITRLDTFLPIELLANSLTDYQPRLEWFSFITLNRDTLVSIEFLNSLSNNWIGPIEFLFGTRNDLTFQVEAMTASLQDNFGGVESLRGIQVDYLALLDSIIRTRSESLFRTELALSVLRELVNPIEDLVAQSGNLIKPVESSGLLVGDLINPIEFQRRSLLDINLYHSWLKTLQLDNTLSKEFITSRRNDTINPIEYVKQIVARQRESLFQIEIGITLGAHNNMTLEVTASNSNLILGSMEFHGVPLRVLLQLLNRLSVSPGKIRISVSSGWINEVITTILPS